MNQETLFFSVIIPTFNRPEQLKKCLNSLVKLNYPSNCYEVIVIDDGGSTELNSILGPFFSQLDLKLYRQSNSGPACARNTGITYAKGEFLAFTDDDCTPDSNWFNALNQQFLKTPNALVGGCIINALNKNIYSISSQLLVDYIYSYYHEEDTDSRQTRFFTSNNLAVKAEIFCEMGGFDTTFPLAAAEDREFCDRWLQKGYQMVYAKNALVYHSHNLTLRKFWQQHFSYGRGAIWFNQSRALRGLDAIKPEPKQFYQDLLRYPYVRGFGYRSPIISVLFSISQIAHSAGCFWERKFPLPKKEKITCLNSQAKSL